MTIDEGMIVFLKEMRANSIDGAKANKINTYGVNLNEIQNICTTKDGIKRVDEIRDYLLQNNMIKIIEQPTQSNDFQTTIAITPEGVLFLMQENNLRGMNRTVVIAVISLIVSALSVFITIIGTICK
jgi:hypothetical protein